MKKFKYSLLLFLLYGFIGYINFATADEYIGVVIGQSRIAADDYDYDPGIFFQLYGGIRKKYYGIEGSYNSTGKFVLTGNNSGTISTSGIAVSGMLFLPLLNNFELYLNVGIFTWTATGDINGGAVPKNKGTDLTTSVGAQYNVAETITVRIAYQMFQNVISGDITSIAVGLAYRF